MGNKISVAQDERDEAEYQSLVQAVEIAHRRARANDLEAGWPHSHHGVSFSPSTLNHATPGGQDGWYNDGGRRLMPSTVVVPIDNPRWRPVVLPQPPQTCIASGMCTSLLCFSCVLTNSLFFQLVLKYVQTCRCRWSQ